MNIYIQNTIFENRRSKSNIFELFLEIFMLKQRKYVTKVNFCKFFIENSWKVCAKIRKFSKSRKNGVFTKRRMKALPFARNFTSNIFLRVSKMLMTWEFLVCLKRSHTAPLHIWHHSQTFECGLEGVEVRTCSGFIDAHPISMICDIYSLEVKLQLNMSSRESMKYSAFVQLAMVSFFPTPENYSS